MQGTGWRAEQETELLSAPGRGHDGQSPPCRTGPASGQAFEHASGSSLVAQSPFPLGINTNSSPEQSHQPALDSAETSACPCTTAYVAHGTASRKLKERQ
ncbi:hypothetical protein J3459_003886 [Metarhizium acridum]|nr:hypothetical protein J3459_003886 [Metarhizium acridum]